MKFNLPKKKFSRSGFTLVELLVSMSVTVIIIGLLVYVTRTSFDTLTDGKSDIKSQQQATMALDALVDDLESLVYRSGNSNQWLVAESIELGGANQTNLGGADDVHVNSAAYATRLAFFTAARDRYNGGVAGAGDVCCAHYGISFSDTTGGTNKSMILYRELIDPNVTFTTHLGLTPDTIPLFTSLEVAGSVGVPANLAASTNVVASNIKEFGITFSLSADDANTGNRVILRVPITKHTVNANSYQFFRLNGNGFDIPNITDITAAAGGGLRYSNITIDAIEISAQVISADKVPLASQIGNLDPRVEQGVTRYSRTITIPQLK